MLILETQLALLRRIAALQAAGARVTIIAAPRQGRTHAAAAARAARTQVERATRPPLRNTFWRDRAEAAVADWHARNHTTEEPPCHPEHPC